MTVKLMKIRMVKEKESVMEMLNVKVKELVPRMDHVLEMTNAKDALLTKLRIS
jgi:hypothetical protein